MQSLSNKKISMDEYNRRREKKLIMAIKQIKLVPPLPATLINHEGSLSEYLNNIMRVIPHILLRPGNVYTSIYTTEDCYIVEELFRFRIKQSLFMVCDPNDMVAQYNHMVSKALLAEHARYINPSMGEDN